MAIGKLFAHWTLQAFAPETLLRKKYTAFRELLEHDDQCLGLIAELEDMLYGPARFDWARVGHLQKKLSRAGALLVDALLTLNPTRYKSLPAYFRKIDFYGELAMDITPAETIGKALVIPLEQALDPLVAGGKAANLARIAAHGDFSVPRGMVASTSAFHYFIEHNQCREHLDELLARVDLEAPEELDTLCGQMRNRILRARVPDDLARELVEAGKQIAGQGRLAVRSSAVAEDGQLSFAGQYDSMLNVAPQEAATAYKRVLAGKYTTRAVAYRVMNGLADQEAPMAVLLQPMIPARFAGVAYSGDPAASPGQDGPVTVFVVPETGEALVEGTQTPQETRFLRQNLEPAGQDGPDSGMGPDQAKQVAKTALALETLFSGPQDVEWAMDDANTIHILQSRPLFLKPKQTSKEPEPSGLPVLQSDLVRVSYGTGAGPLHFHETGERFETTPPGSVLVVKTLSPSLAAALGRAVAVVAEVGSRAGHFASVAREHGLPVVSGADIQALPRTGTITVDAGAGAIHQGAADPEDAEAPEPPPQTPAQLRLAKALKHIARLNLTDPQADNFCPEGIRTMHDLVRFAHEQSVAEMFSLVGDGGRGMGKARKLKSHLPLVLYILDLGGGLGQSREDGAASPEDILCPAMQSFWQGLADPDEQWDKSLVHVDWNRFDQMSGGIMSRDSRLLASYALISKDYAHLLVRFGYHFSVLDTLCGDTAKNNHLSFSFRGGGGSHMQRLLRLAFIEQVLGGFGFEIEIRGDLLEATFNRADATTTREKLILLGRLCAHTRLMDMAMDSREQAEDLAKGFSAVLAGTGTVTAL